MYKTIAMINYIIEEKEGVSIVCKVYADLKIGDTFIYVYNNKKYYFVIEKILGFKEKDFLEAVQGCVYRIVVKNMNAEKSLLKYIRFGDLLFGESFSEVKHTLNPLLPDFEKIENGDKEQFYKIIINYRCLDKNIDEEINDLIKLVHVLKEYQYRYEYDKDLHLIKNMEQYLKNQVTDHSKLINTGKIIRIYNNKQFYILAYIGTRNRNLCNKVEILLPEHCTFFNNSLNSKIIDLFKGMNDIFNPYWSYVCNNENIKRFQFTRNSSLPTSIHHINYFGNSLRIKIQKYYQISLTNYLECRLFPFDNYSENDIKIQEELYKKYMIDKMTLDLRKSNFNSEEELLFYCDIL